MERIIILLVVLAGLYCVMRFINRTRLTKPPKRPIAQSRNNVNTAGDTSFHSTPGNNLLANKQKLWDARRLHASHLGSRVTGFRATKYFEQDPAYDGYSRRDRHHLAPAHIEEEKQIEGVTNLPNKFKPSKSQAAEKQG